MGILADLVPILGLLVVSSIAVYQWRRERQRLRDEYFMCCDARNGTKMRLQRERDEQIAMASARMFKALEKQMKEMG